MSHRLVYTDVERKILQRCCELYNSAANEITTTVSYLTSFANIQNDLLRHVSSERPQYILTVWDKQNEFVIYDHDNRRVLDEPIVEALDIVILELGYITWLIKCAMKRLLV